MKKIKKISSLLGVFIFCLSLNLFAGDKPEVQYVAVHFGDPAYADVLDRSEFPEFSFYTVPGDAFGYSEAQKMFGKTTYLTGWYGEVPEKMGFCANYRGEYKNKSSFPHAIGTAYIIDQKGTIAYQLPPEKFYGAGWADKRDGIRHEMSRELRRAKKGKEVKVLKEKKRDYLKETSYGELEETKGSDVDKNGEGLIEWPVPDLKVTDDEGNEVSLKELTQGKATVLVFYTLNGVTWKKGDKDGNIVKEWKGNKLLNKKDYEKIAEEEFTQEAKEKGALKTTAKMALKDGVFGSSRSAIREILSGEGEIDAKKKFQAYQYFLQNLWFVKKFIAPFEK